MDDSLHNHPGRRRRALWWGMFGLTGIIMGSVYAAGFSSSQTDAGAVSTSPVLGDPVSDQSPSPYAGFLTSPEDLTIGFVDEWGTVAADETVFRVDLTTATAGTYYVDILVQNVPVGFSALQLKWVEAVDAAEALECTSGTATDVDFTTDYATAVSNNDHEPKLMNITDSGDHVSFGGLASGSVYCFGIADIAQADDDPDGTVIVRQTGATPTMPEFMGIVNRSA